MGGLGSRDVEPAQSLRSRLGVAWENFYRWLLPELVAISASALGIALMLMEGGAVRWLASLISLCIASYSYKTYRDRVRLYENLRREQRWTELLYETSVELGASLSLEDVLTSTLLRVSGSVGATRGSLLLLEPESGRLLLVGTVEHGEIGAGQRGVSHLRLGTGLAGWVAKAREGVLVNDVQEDLRWRWFDDAPPRRDVRSAICAPLVSESVLVGVITLTHPKVGHFTPEHLRQLTTIASPVAAAICNAKLYEAVTAEKEKADLERSRLDAIIAHLPLGLAMVDRDLRVVVANPAFTATLGISEPVEPGCPLLAALTPSVLGRAEDPDALLAFLANCHLGSDQLVEGLLTLRAPRRHISLLAAPIRDTQGGLAGRAVIAHDVTTQWEIDRLKSEFVANVSHELRTPLASIKAYSEVLLDNREGMDASLRAQFLGVIQQEADRLQSMVEDILDLSRLETGQITVAISSVDLAEVAQEAILLLQVQAQPRGVNISATFGSSAPFVEADARMMRTLVKNLLDNAVKYNRDGGAVAVSIQDEGESICLEVHDTGPGIPAEALPHLFEKFYRVSPLEDDGHQGTGLGLALVKQIVDFHGGRVEVKSELGRGSLFRVTLPKQWHRWKGASGRGSQSVALLPSRSAGTGS